MPRISINVSDEIKQYFENKSKETNASQSALMCLALSEYIEGKQAIKDMPRFIKLMELAQKQIDEKESEKNDDR